jgi:hypothetical protein
MPLEMLALAANYASSNPRVNEMVIKYNYFPALEGYAAGWYIDAVSYFGDNGIVEYFI